MRSPLRATATILSCFNAAGCGGGSDEASAEGASEAAELAPGAPFAVEILSPARGSFQEEHEVVVWLRSTVPIVPAGDVTPGTGHAVVAEGAHIPLQPLVVDTVTFTVE
ncbi:MAG: hypothetical protein FJ207_11440 [Gemmatimonadetes bacterium]|nr:hypothetical protein [Gemmatimonadota bacterium]